MSTGEGPGSPARCCGDRWGTWVDQRSGTLVGRALWGAWGSTLVSITWKRWALRQQERGAPASPCLGFKDGDVQV